MKFFVYIAAAVLLLAVVNAVSPKLKPQDIFKDVAQHYGYININKTRDANLFYWMFESQKDPSNDPLVLWMTGGPGCSSELALFFENGPYTVNADGSLLTNPYSWNKFANLLYIDQPFGTGFSYADSDYVHDEKQVGREMLTFIQKFLTMYPQYAKLDFYIIGESYGGHYVPTVGYSVQKAVAQGAKINLKGIAIGNGWVDPYIQYGAYGPFAYENKLINTATYSQINATYEQCKRYLDNQDWDDADDVCSNTMGLVLESAGNINVYNIDLPCSPPPLCYDFSNITSYLNNPSVQAKLGVHNIQWQTCSDDVNGEFTVDRLQNFEWEIPYLLDSGLRVLVYNGDLDLICNWVGGSQWVADMTWSGQKQYLSAPTKTWSYSGVKGGSSKSFGPLTFLRVFQAGHMVPHDQPAAALALLGNFLNNKPF